MKRFILFPVLVLFLIVAINDANAVVRVVDVDANAEAEFPELFTSGTVDTGGETNDTQAGDYVLLICSTNGEGPNSFFPPVPDGWTELDTGLCGTAECIHGVWGSFRNTANIEEITCSWGEPHSVFVGGTFRYRDVDVSDPIINVACQSGSGNEAIAPSIISEPKSQVVRLATVSFPDDNCPNIVEEITTGVINACAETDVQNVLLTAFTTTGFDGGPTGEAVAEFSDDADAVWRACTIGIRMAPTPIPTMSEWGLIAVAAFMGIAGVLYIRRRSSSEA